MRRSTRSLLYGATAGLLVGGSTMALGSYAGLSGAIPLGWISGTSALICGITLSLLLERLHDSRQRILAAVVDAVPNPLMVKDRSGRVVMVNRATADLLDRPRDSLIGLGTADLLGVEDAAPFDREDLETLRGGKARHFEERLRLPNGEERVFLVGAAPLGLVEEEGYLVRSLVDVTAIKHAEAHANEAEQRFAAFARHLPAQVFLKSQDGRFIYANEAMVRALGMDPTGQLDRDLPGLDPDSLEDMAASDRRAISDGLIAEESNWQDAQGRMRHSLLRKFAVPREDLEPLIGGVALDITEQKQAQDDLIRAKEAAEAANQAKSRFLAVMSHELRTPLTAVIGMNQLLLESPLDEQQRELAQIAVSSARSLLDLIRDVLDFSKIEANRLDLDIQPFRPREVLDEVTRMLGVTARGKGVRLAVAVGDNVPDMAVGDPVRLRQVLINLVGNAIKFTDNGEVQVLLHVLPSSSGTLFLRGTVQDSGPGIADSLRPRLFQPFTQGDDGLSRRHGGTGLGLSICKRLCEMMGGSIHHDESWTDGARFVFTIALRPLPVQA